MGSGTGGCGCCGGVGGACGGGIADRRRHQRDGVLVPGPGQYLRPDSAGRDAAACRSDDRRGCGQRLDSSAADRQHQLFEHQLALDHQHDRRLGADHAGGWRDRLCGAGGCGVQFGCRDVSERGRQFDHAELLRRHGQHPGRRHAGRHAGQRCSIPSPIQRPRRPTRSPRARSMASSMPMPTA